MNATEKVGAIICIGVGIITSYFTISNVFNSPTPDYIQLFILLLTLPFILVGLLILKSSGSEKEQEQKRNITIITKYKGIKIIPDSDGGSREYIVTSWVNPIDNKLYLFSRYIGIDLLDCAKESNIKEYPVKYELNNIRNYEIDISKLEEVNHEESK